MLLLPITPVGYVSMKNELFFAWFVIAVGLCFCQPNSGLGQDRPNPSGTVKVILLAGQSNMQGHGVVDLDHAQHYNGGKGILNSLLADEQKKELVAHAHDENGNWITRDDVFIRYQTSDGLKSGGLSVGFTGHSGKHHIGPEFQFGHLLGDYFDEPVLLIKTAWGGKSLQTDFRPPSAGGTVGPFYKQMIQEYQTGIKNISTEFPQLSGKEIELCGFVWMQGWNDMVDQTARDEYQQNLIHLINDVRDELESPGLPVVVGELGNGGKKANNNMLQFRKSQQRACAIYPFVGNVEFVRTAQFARDKQDSPNVGHLHHWFGNAESYFLIGDALGKSMIRLLQWQNKKRVLILGDSISMGYGPTVAKQLADLAFVVRPRNQNGGPENCAGTIHGVKRIDDWLQMGGGNWDIIHFNFGLHDLKHVKPDGKNSNDANDPPQADLVAYEKNLREIVAKLETTGATLIYCTTTPYPAGVKPFRDPASAQQYNAVAKRIMLEHDIQINDLHAFANGRLEKIQQPVNVHFSKEGSAELGKFVAEKIRAALE